MPAANTDKFQKGARKLSGTIDSSGIINGTVDNWGMGSGASIPTDTAVEITIDRVDSNGAKTPDKEEVIRGVVSVDRIISAVRGVEGTAQPHSAGAVWEMRLTASMWNRFIDGILTFATQTGKLILSALDGPRYGADAGGDDTYAVTLDPVPAAYYAGMEVNFKPTTANTGACTLDVNSLGAKTIKKSVSSDLATGDILAGQMVKVIYDGTNFQLVSATPGDVIFAMQRNSSAQSIANATTVKILTNTADKTVGNINNDTVNSKIIINKAGFYFLTLYMGFGDNINGSFRIPSFRLNGAGVLDIYIAKTTVSGGIRLTVTHYVQLAVNDYIDIAGYQDSGAALNVIAGAYFTVERISD